MTDPQTKTRGILMSSWSINRYMAGCKSQTRRIKGLEKINRNPDEWKFVNIAPQKETTSYLAVFEKMKTGYLLGITLPYGQIGDTLYFKETWRAWEDPQFGQDFIQYKADDSLVSPVTLGWDPTKPDEWNYLCGKFDKWQPSMFMKQAVARFRDIPIIDVRVERLHKIPSNDVLAEGISRTDDGSWLGPLDGVPDFPYAHASEAYFALWDSINKKTMPAEKNPWLWVYEFPIYQEKTS